MSDAPPCLSCGACCFSALETYVCVTGADYARLGELAERVSGFIGNRCYMRMHEGRCAALAVDPAGRYVCSIYEQRPEVCRELERGSSACEAERTRKSERATLAAQSLSRAHRSRLPGGCASEDHTANTRTETLIVARGSAGPR